MPLDQRGEFVRPVQQVERSEIVASAGVVAPPLARAEQDTGIGAHRRLACLHIEVLGMQRDFAGNGDAAFVAAQIVFAGIKAERFGEVQEPRAGMMVKAALGVGVVGDTFLEIEAGGCIGHERNSGERERPPRRNRPTLGQARTALLAPGSPSRALSSPSWLPQETAAAQDPAAPFGRTPCGTSPVRKAGMSSLSPSSPASICSG